MPEITWRAIDRLAQQWLELEKLEANLAKRYDRVHARILAAVKRDGTFANNAKAMKTLPGWEFELQAVFPIECVIDQKRAARFLRRCPKHLRRYFFLRATKFTLSPRHNVNADAKIPTPLLALFSKAITGVPRAPRVKVIKLKRARKVR